MALQETATVTDPFRSFPLRLGNLLRKKKYAQALTDLRLLAEQDCVEAAVMMAHIHFYGGGGVRKDYAIAKQWLEVIDTNNYKDACTSFTGFHLGVIHYKGLGVTSDHTVAYRHFRRSGLSGDPRSLLNVGWMQRDGDGVIRKPVSSKVILFRCSRDRELSFAYRCFALALAIGLFSPLSPRKV